MVTDKGKVAESSELSVSDKLKALHDLQIIDSQVDRIKLLRGELPLEVQDLEDEIEGLETRLKNLEQEVVTLDASITKKTQDIAESKSLIKKYEEQQKNVRNNREFDSLNKEIEFQNLEIELCEKRIKEFSIQSKDKKKFIEDSIVLLTERKADLSNKRQELNEIVSETKKEEDALYEKSEACQRLIEPRLLSAYKRLRVNARNGLAVVTVKRDACGGCFNKIPPQRQLDIRLGKKVIVCEYCGRILVDDTVAGEELA
jgi:predicted  nucleic acid-binding Zn-ribbon protein